jgi:hypothetical protein
MIGKSLIWRKKLCFNANWRSIWHEPIGFNSLRTLTLINQPTVRRTLKAARKRLPSRAKANQQHGRSNQYRFKNSSHGKALTTNQI